MNNSLKNIDASKNDDAKEKYYLANGLIFSISNESVTPKVGNQTTQFNFSIIFTNPKNTPPKSIDVIINGTVYPLEKLNLTDYNYIDGCIYKTQMNMTPSANNYTYYFRCSNGTNYQTTIIYNDLQVFNEIIWSSVNLENVKIGTVITHGEGNPRTTYASLVNELEGRGATLTDITTIIDSSLLQDYDILWIMTGGSSMSNSEIDAIEQWVHDGGSFLISHTFTGAPLGLAQKFNISSGSFSGLIYPPSTIYPHPITQSVKTVEVYSISIYLDLSLQPKANNCVRFAGYDSIVAMEHGNGSLVIILNTIPIRINRLDNRLLCHNTFGWLSHKKNDFTPILEEEKVTPLEGNQLTNFNFSVNYFDQDNDSPEFVAVLINGTYYPMEKINTLDVNYTDGCSYQYLTVLSPAIYNYSYSFKCADREFYTSTISRQNLYVKQINNFIPAFTNGHVNLKRGPQGSILYDFLVNYTDPENNPPLNVNLTINSLTFSMNKQDLLDNNYTDGVIYSYTTSLSPGIYSYFFNCSDGLYKNSNGPYFNLFVRNWSILQLQNLNIGTVISHGEQNPRTKYSTLISDLYSRGAIVSDITEELTLTILSEYNLIWFDEGGVSMNSNEIEVIEQWVHQGGQIITTGDGFGTILSLAQKFNISIIDGGHRSGSTNDIFAHPITQKVEWTFFSGVGEYLDISLQPLANPCVKLDGFNQIITMNYGKGDVIMILEDFGWNIGGQDNFLLLKNTFGWYSRMKNDNSPFLSEGEVLPLSGNQITLFNFSITYFDQDNNHPEAINVHINDTIYVMEKINPLDLNYTDGSIYQLLTYLSPSTSNYSYFFSCADRDFNYSTIEYTGLKISQTNDFKPQLISPNVNPVKGTIIDVYKFTVWYYDNDNDLPLYINIKINQTIYPMERENTSDNWSLDGIKYFYSTTLSQGFYTFQINCSDGVFMNTTNWINGPEVEWDLTSSPIFIDDNNPNYNWNKTATENEWCTGSGTIIDPYIINNVLIDRQSSGYCIEIKNSDIYFIINGCTLFNSGIANAGIVIDNVTNGKIVDNICYNNYMGITLYSGSSKNTILRNIVYSNVFAGISIRGSNNNTILYNSVYSNGELGIHLGGSDYNIVKYNDVKQNQESGICLYLSNYNKLFKNCVLQNTIEGFNMEFSGNNLIFDNMIKDNINYGIYLSGVTSRDNLFFNNTLINNNINAYNIGGINYWNDSVIGNYWDDYGGIDLNGDNIGDTPHNFGTGLDYLPIWDINPPKIIINTPSPNKIFSYPSPKFNISIVDDYLHTSWYTIENNLVKYIFIETNGTINQAAWDLYANGSVKVTFYANDTWGNIAYIEITIHKDIEAPEIFINFPRLDEFFGSIAPQFELYINEGNLFSVWYTIDNGNNNFTLNELTGTLDQIVWDTKGNEFVTIRFYANDTLGNVSYSEIIIQKDIMAPISLAIFIPHSGIDIVNESTVFFLTSDDDQGSGVSLIRYKINDSNWIQFGSPFTLASYPYGNILISYQAVDQVGNFETIQMLLVHRTDTTTPESSISFTSYGDPDIVIKSTTFTITADDGLGSGVSLVRYKINDSNWITFTEPFNLSRYEYGDYNVTYQAIDVIGNVEIENSIIVTLVEPSQPGIPGYNVFLLIGAIYVVSAIIMRKQKHSR